MQMRVRLEVSNVEEKLNHYSSIQFLDAKNYFLAGVQPSTPKSSFKYPLQKKEKVPEEAELKRKIDEAFTILQSNVPKNVNQRFLRQVRRVGC